MPDLEALKKQAALKALKHVESGMLLGLGTGSTAKHFIDSLGQKLQSGELKNITGIATSKASEEQATSLGIPLVNLTGQILDLAVDGMDEVNEELNAIKGLGGALTREKMVESCASHLILIGDGTKIVKHIGEKAPIPVEVVQFAWQATQTKLERLKLRPVLRKQASQVFVTDNGNYILDCHLEPADNIHELATAISVTAGVVEHGLFLDMAELAYVATTQGVISMTKPT